MSIKEYLPADIILDQAQLCLIDSMEQITASLHKRSWFNLFGSGNNVKGFYLYGGVGLGKTMLMQAFCRNLKISVSVIHYQDFMLSLHQNLHKLQGNSTEQIIKNLAKHYSEQWQVLCLDEFEIKDITDAMIIGRLFVELNKHNIFIFLTTNTKPEELYKDGLQRDTILPFINYLNERFFIFSLDSDHDYRLPTNAITGDRVLYPFTSQNQCRITGIIDNLIEHQSLVPCQIELFGRKIYFHRSCNDILVTDFHELCMQDYGYADYVKICQGFKIIIVENVTKINETKSDLVTRFINFIDNAYFYKVLLFITLEDAPEKIYPSGRLSKEFKRTISRLSEMNNPKYPMC